MALAVRRGASSIYLNGGAGHLRRDRAARQPRDARHGWASAATRSSRALVVVHRIGGARSARPTSIKEIEARAVRRAGADRPSPRRLKGDDASAPASRGIARLARISDWADSRHNVFLRLSEIPLLFTLQVAYAAESWRASAWLALARLGRRGRRDGSAALARRLFVRTSVDPFAGARRRRRRRCSTRPKSRIRLMPASDAVSNSLVLGAQAPSPRPQAAGPDRERLEHGRQEHADANRRHQRACWRSPARRFAPRRLRLTPLAIGTCLRHTDSLQEHRSGFYTEALRIRADLRSARRAAAGAVPVRRAAERHQLQGSPHRRRGRGAHDAVARRDRDGDDARSVADRDRGDLPGRGQERAPRRTRSRTARCRSTTSFATASSRTATRSS